MTRGITKNRTSRGNDCVALIARSARGRRLRTRILAAFLKLVEKRHSLPSGDELSRLAGCSERSIYTHYTGRKQLIAEACEIVKTRIGPAVEVEAGASDLSLRVRSYVDRWSRTGEEVGGLFRALNNLQDSPGDFTPTGRWVAEQRIAEIESHFAPELGALAGPQRGCLIVAIEVLTDFAAWTRLHRERGMTRTDISKVWAAVITRMLAPRPQDEGGASDRGRDAGSVSGELCGLHRH